MTKYIDRYYLNGEVYGIKFGGEGWQPGADTIAYYPLNSDLLDHSGKSFSSNVFGNVSIGTAGGVSAGYFGDIGEISGTVNITEAVTALGYIYRTGDPYYDNASVFGFAYSNMGSPIAQIFYAHTRPSNVSNKPGVVAIDEQRPSVTAVTVPLNTWMHCAVTFNLSTKQMSFYVNGALQYQYTSTETLTPNVIGLSRSNDLNRSWIGYLSNVIFENKVRTATEISDYYNQTKSLYGIS